MLVEYLRLEVDASCCGVNLAGGMSGGGGGGSKMGNWNWAGAGWFLIGNRPRNLDMSAAGCRLQAVRLTRPFAPAIMVSPA